MLTQATRSPQVRGAPRARAGAVLVAVLVLDQLTKHILTGAIGVGQEQRLVLGIRFVHVRNPGVAFGFFSGGGALVLVFTLVALGVLIGYFLLRSDRRLLWLPTGMLIGGALGNLIDRLAHGDVTDFIKLPLWPAFNVADTAITFGVLILLYVLEGGRRR